MQSLDRAADPREIRLDIPAETFEALVDAIVERVLVRLDGRLAESAPRWLHGAAAAAQYLGCSRERVYKRLAELPHFRIGARLAFDRAELDRYVQEHRAR